LSRASPQYFDLSSNLPPAFQPPTGTSFTLSLRVKTTDNGLSRVDATISSWLAASADPTSALATLQTTATDVQTDVDELQTTAAGIAAKTSQLTFTGTSVNAYSTNVLASGAIISISPS
jgi:hypothetical protein